VQVRRQLLDDADNARSVTLAESQQLLSQMTAQKENLRAETTERIASALQEHNSDVAHQVSVLDQWSYICTTGKPVLACIAVLTTA